MSVVVITPTTGSHHLAKAMESTNSQACEHWIVIDGEEHAQKVADILQAGEFVNKKIIMLPHNTGRPKEFYGQMPRGRMEDQDGFFNGHRIYASMSYLINKPYVMFLDEDNWYDKNHVEIMLAMMSAGINWCYTLRRLVDQEGNVIGEDNCDSLGVFANQRNVNCVDMNCYCFKTDFLVSISQALYTGHKADKSLYKAAYAKNDPFEPMGCTGMSTVNYRISRDNQQQWFAEGNKKMNKLYNGQFPWRIK
jgi:hypothetical protein